MIFGLFFLLLGDYQASPKWPIQRQKRHHLMMLKHWQGRVFARHVGRGCHKRGHDSRKDVFLIQSDMGFLGTSQPKLGGGNSSLFFCHPDPWGNDPI